MALKPFFSLSPLNTRDYNYNAATPNAAYANAHLEFFGGFTRYGKYALLDQYNTDEYLLGYDPVGVTDQTVQAYADSFYRRCTARISFEGYNIDSQNQFLLIFGVRGLQGNPSAQFFVGGDFLRTEQLSEDEQVAILMDSLGSGSSITIHIRLAAAANYAAMAFQGVDCYLL